RQPEELIAALEATAREATTYFGDGTVYAERYLEDPRHIEVQVFGDNHGNAIHLFERECSVQRRYQKIIEECPSPSVNTELRQRITSAAVKITQAIGYSNAGTIEFLLEGDKDFFFLEMNTRIQVEHPVTEMVTGVDLVEEQILVAAGNPLSIKQDALILNGNAIECRIYAEDPQRGFLPSPGKMTFYSLPEGENIRVESGINRNLEVPADYDPMVAKVIVWGRDRSLAIERMEMALRETVIHGIASNIPFLMSLLRHPDYRENRISTKYIDARLESLLPVPPTGSQTPLAAYILWWLNTGRRPSAQRPLDVWDSIGYWRQYAEFRLMLNSLPHRLSIGFHSANAYRLLIDGAPADARILEVDNHRIRFTLEDSMYAAYVSEDGQGKAWISLEGELNHLEREDILVTEDVFTSSGSGSGGDPGRIISPMPGKVVKINVKEGDQVKRGQLILIVEAMKMENNILAPADGLVDAVNVKAGDNVDTRLALVHLSVIEEGD
ncbi:MAG: biotin/lipoyl-binding protein, partial [Bacteroidales bacterium]|nr:biotin/lipoyl-binding protein [Bacteroidales bacterium]